MTRHNLAAATHLIVGDDSGLADPQRWVTRQLKTGRFRGFKIGRQWFMTSEDVAAAQLSLYPHPDGESKPETAGTGSRVVDGLSAGARRRLRSAS